MSPHKWSVIDGEVDMKGFPAGLRATCANLALSTFGQSVARAQKKAPETSCPKTKLL